MMPVNVISNDITTTSAAKIISLGFVRRDGSTHWAILADLADGACAACCARDGGDVEFTHHPAFAQAAT
jgi:hypothetical protein